MGVREKTLIRARCKNEFDSSLISLCGSFQTKRNSLKEKERDTRGRTTRRIDENVFFFCSFWFFWIFFYRKRNDRKHKRIINFVVVFFSFFWGPELFTVFSSFFFCCFSKLLSLYIFHGTINRTRMAEWTRRRTEEWQKTEFSCLFFFSRVFKIFFFIFDLKTAKQRHDNDDVFFLCSFGFFFIFFYFFLFTCLGHSRLSRDSFCSTRFACRFFSFPPIFFVSSFFFCWITRCEEDKNEDGCRNLFLICTQTKRGKN